MTHPKRETHRFDHARHERLLDPSRYGGVDPGEILRRVGAGPGQVILDFGCGPGYFTASAADIVGPQGRVIAADVQTKMVGEARRRVRAANVDFLVLNSGGPELEPGSVDLVFIANVAHELEEPAAEFALMRSWLKPGAGRLAIVDWKAEDTGGGPPVEHRLSIPVLGRYLETAGFTILSTFEIAPTHYALQAAP
jgi:ubiquinone/menaquinone biosynthesis C-methylase UbiE